MKKNIVLGLIVICAIVAVSLSCKNALIDKDAITELKYDLSNEIFPNPERGFMHLYDVGSEGEGLVLTELKALRNENVTLIHRMYYFEKFKDQPLSDTELSLIRADMQKIRDAGIKCILCFAYTGQDYVYNTENGEDAPYSTIELHLNQLKSVFEENEDVIAFVQAGFIGPWGEWHSSTNGLETTYYKTMVLEKMLSVIPAGIMVQVRTPGYKQEIFGTVLPTGEEIAYSGENRARVGHYNDCFMSSADDYGTYSNIEADKEYISKDALFVPTGGETCPPVPDDYPTGCSVAKSTMKLLRWTYLNLDWYQPTINGWRSSGCFDEFQRNLGYRLSLVDANFLKHVGIDPNLKIDIEITNKGYAPLYNYKITSLVLKNIVSGEFSEFLLPVDLRRCKPFGNFRIEDTINLKGIPQGSYYTYLKISDRSENLKNRIEYSVRLANSNTWTEEYGGMNDLKYVLKIENK
jgi:hypothetical protein